jgi:hypothetical protein
VGERRRQRRGGGERKRRREEEDEVKATHAYSVFYFLLVLPILQKLEEGNGKTYHIRKHSLKAESNYLISTKLFLFIFSGEKKKKKNFPN